MNDHIDNAINSRHVVCVTSDTTVETALDNVSRVIYRGVYTFDNEETARRFTSNVNDTTETKTAHYFSRNK